MTSSLDTNWDSSLTSWSSINKIIFRFFFIYLILFILFLPLRPVLDPVLAVLGRSIFKLEDNLISVSTGSGDGTMAWLSLFLQTVLAIIGTLLWSVLDYRRSGYVKMQFWLLRVITYFTAIVMLFYGAAKVFLIQFQTPSYTALLKPLGEMSPMGLAWTFMGFSPAYSIFTGLLEVIAGLLLIFKRTRVLGAVMVVGIMTHVAVMNLCFDIPVKILSLHLVLMGSVILIAYRHRLYPLFLYKAATPSSAAYHPLLRRRFYNNLVYYKALITGLLIVVILGLGTLIRLELKKDLEYDDDRGIWEVTEFIKNGDTLAPLPDNDLRWNYVIFEAKGKANIKHVNDSIISYYVDIDSTETTAAIYGKKEQLETANFKFNRLKKEQIKLEGVLKSDSLEVLLQKKNLKKFHLINRGFRWVSERPFNR